MTIFLISFVCVVVLMGTVWVFAWLLGEELYLPATLFIALVIAATVKTASHYLDHKPTTMTTVECAQ